MSRSSGRRPARSCALALLGLLAGLLASGPAAAGGRELGLGEAGTLWLPVPSTWTVTPERREGPYPTWEIAPPDAGGAILLVTPTWGQVRHGAIDLRFQLAQEVERGHREWLAAAEQRLRLGERRAPRAGGERLALSRRPATAAGPPAAAGRGASAGGRGADPSGRRSPRRTPRARPAGRGRSG